MPGYETLRRLSPEQHEAAVKLVSEAMASAALEALMEPAALQASLRDLGGKPVTEAFTERASDFLDIRGDLTEFIREGH